MKSNSNLIGQIGEDITAKYLKTKGFVITAKNYHSRFGEIDVIAENNELILFVEVKTRCANSIASPAEFVDRRKQQKIIATARLFIYNNSVALQPRFDVAEIITAKSGDFSDVKINYIENAFGDDG
ncbi:MAG: YraN family protein [Oscillospiraceae bacterium]|nr:YraN family protein [Oscillospiraceae bacterium]